MGTPSWKTLFIFGLALSMGACSTSKNASDMEDADEPALTADAGTDAVPKPGAETPAPAPMPTVAPAQVMTQPPPAPADPTPTPMTPAAAGAMESQTYTVQAGDTLMKIAFENTGDLYKWKDIYEANKDKISNPNSIPVGIIIKIDKVSPAPDISKNGEKYLIKPGDTLGTISSSLYGTKTKWKDIWENNKQLIRDPNKIFAGFYLYYMPAPPADAAASAPGGSMPALTPAPAADASAAPAPPVPAK